MKAVFINYQVLTIKAEDNHNLVFKLSLSYQSSTILGNFITEKNTV